MKLPDYISLDEVKRVCEELKFKDWTAMVEPDVSPEEARRVLYEHRLEKLVDIRRERLSLQQAFNPEQIEMAIYVTVINILDHYQCVDLDDPRGCELVAQIGALLPECADYDDLVEGLCRLRL